MDGEADCWITSGKIRLPPPLARVMGVGRQQVNSSSIGIAVMPSAFHTCSVSIVVVQIVFSSLLHV